VELGPPNDKMKPNFIELPGCEPIPILYEDRTVIAVDKPRGWMLAPVAWQNTSRNLQAAIESSIAAHDFWAQSRGLKFLRHVHRLDADTSGVLLLAKSPGAVKRFFDLFESRKMEKTYLAVVVGEPKKNEWTCELKLAPDKKRFRKMKVDERFGKEAETHFRVLQSLSGYGVTSSTPSDFGVRRHVGALKSGDTSPHSTRGLRLRGDRAATAAQARGRSPHQSRVFETRGRFSLIEARPVTGRTHQIRVHLAEAGLPVVGDELYGKGRGDAPLGLRAVRLTYIDPFMKRRVDIHAPTEKFLKEFGFSKR
jgi:23S rRNA-/tRNA-specific pseudouridylate synthase